MLDNVKIEDILFIDIETVPAVSDFNLLNDTMKILWERKSKQFKIEELSSEELYKKAGIYSEFGKIICISAGLIAEKNPLTLRLKSFYGDDEKAILDDFSAMLSKFAKPPKEALLCAHNGKEFDFPYIARRMIINNVKIPALLDNAGKKPWEIKLLDTMELWKFGDYKSYTSLDLLTTILGIPTPKDDIDGSMVADIYFKDNDIERIAKYCEKDVTAIVQTLLRFMNKPLIEPDKIESVTFPTEIKLF